MIEREEKEIDRDKSVIDIVTERGKEKERKMERFKVRETHKQFGRRTHDTHITIFPPYSEVE